MGNITIMRFFKKLLILGVLLSLNMSPARADASLDEQKLVQCLDHAERAPDMAFAEADKWVKDGGTDRAHLCRAFARFHRSEFNLAAEEFSALAAARDVKDRRHAAPLHTQAGLSYMRAGNNRQAEIEYAAALKLEPQDPDVWVDRATERAGNERYWDAIDDLNQALSIMPDMPEALRLRAQSWVQLGQTSKARSDFERAAIVDGGDEPEARPAAKPSLPAHP